MEKGLNTTNDKKHVEIKTPLPPFFGRRSVAFLFDVVLIALLSACLELGMSQAFGFSSKADAYNKYEDEITSYTKETHLLSDDDYLYPSTKGEATLKQTWIKNIAEISGDYDLSLDCLHYYAVSFLKESEDSYLDYVSKSEQVSYFDLTGSYPVLTVDSKDALVKYYGGAQNVASYAKVYEDISTFFSNTYHADWIKIMDDHLYSDTIVARQNAWQSVALATTHSSLISYFLIAVLYYVGTPFIFKKGRTLGKKLSGIELTTSSYKPIKTKQMVFRGILESMEFTFILAITPYFLFPNNTLSLALFYVNGSPISIWSLVLASLLLTLASGLTLCLRMDKCSLHDMAVLTRPVLSSSWPVVEDSYDRK